MGSLLYETLTGMPPYLGGVAELLARKVTLDPSPVLQVAPAAPPALAELCDRLLARDPARRPDGAALLAALGRAEDSAPIPRPAARAFVGRRAELEVLHQALARLERGKPIAAALVGPSGIGKTAIVDQFLTEVDHTTPAAVVLQGRCHDRESVPFRAFDGIVDDLSRVLATLTSGPLPIELPPTAARVVPIFPTLATVDAVRAMAPAGGDKLDLRDRAFDAFRALLGWLARARPVILTIDDAQWADDDSLELLGHLMDRHAAPPLLVVLVVRGEPGDEPCPAERRARRFLARLPIGGLGAADARELARATLDDDAAIERVVAEAAGHPVFVEELARTLRGGAADPGARISLDDTLRRRVAGLDDDSRRLLQVIATGGGPVPQEVCARIAAMDPPTFARCVERLRAERLVRLRGARAHDTVDTYHTRLRDLVYADLDEPHRVAIHRFYGLELRETGAPAEEIAEHFVAAGERERAAEHYQRAAVAAAEALAFQHAATLYAAALATGNHADGARSRLLAAQASALVEAGRPRDAAETFVAAARLCAGDADELALLRRAAEQYLQNGYHEDGAALVARIMHRLGLRFPRTQSRALASALWSTARLRASRLRWQPRPPARPARDDELATLDALWSVGSGLAYSDTFRALHFTMKGALLALDVGDDHRVARALSAAALNQIVVGQLPFARRLIEAIARACRGSAGTAFWSEVTDVGWRFWIDNAWSGTIAGVDRCTRLWHDAGHGDGFELDIVHQFRYWAMYHSGNHREAARQVRRRISRWRRSGKRMLEISFRNYFAHLPLLDDAVDEAERDADDAIASWSATWSDRREDFTLQHYWNVLSRTYMALYRGDVEHSAAALEPSWRKVKRSLYTRLLPVRFECASALGAVCVARAAEARARGEHSAARGLLREARKHERVLAALGIPTAVGGAHTLRAGIARVAGDDDAYVAALRAAVAHYREHGGVGLPANAARLAAAVGGSEADDLRADVARWVRDNAVKDPDRLFASVVGVRPKCLSRDSGNHDAHAIQPGARRDVQRASVAVAERAVRRLLRHADRAPLGAVGREHLHAGGRGHEQVARRVDRHAVRVGHRRRQHALVSQRAVAGDVVGAHRPGRVGHVQHLLVRRQRDPVGPRRQRALPLRSQRAAGRHPEHPVERQLLRLPRRDAVRRIREVDRAVAAHRQVVGRIQRHALVAGRDVDELAVAERARHAPVAVLRREQQAVDVGVQAVGVAARRPERGDRRRRLELVDRVGRDVGEQQHAVGGPPRRPFQEHVAVVDELHGADAVQRVHGRAGVGAATAGRVGRPGRRVGRARAAVDRPRPVVVTTAAARRDRHRAPHRSKLHAASLHGHDAGDHRELPHRVAVGIPDAVDHLREGSFDLVARQLGVRGDRVGVAIAPRLPDAGEDPPVDADRIDRHVVHAHLAQPERPHPRVDRSPAAQIRARRLGVAPRPAPPELVHVVRGRVKVHHRVVFRDHVQPPTRLRDPHQVGEHLLRPRHRLQQVPAHRQVELVVERQLHRVGDAEHGAVAEPRAPLPRPLQVGRVEVHPEQARARDQLEQPLRQLPGPARQVQDRGALRHRVALEQRPLLRPDRGGLRRQVPQHRLVRHLIALRVVGLAHPPVVRQSRDAR